MSDMPRAAAALLERTRRAHGPSDLEREQVLARLGASLEFADPVGFDAAQASAGPDLVRRGFLTAQRIKLSLVALSVLGGSALALFPRGSQSSHGRAAQSTAQTVAAPAASDSTASSSTVYSAHAKHEALGSLRQTPLAGSVAAAEVREVRTGGSDSQTSGAEATARSGGRSAPSGTRAKTRARADQQQSAVHAARTTTRTAGLHTSPAPTTLDAASTANNEAKASAEIVPASRFVARPTEKASQLLELDLIDRALLSLRDQKPGQALDLLAEHRTQYPASRFATERDGLRVLALCAAGRTREGLTERAAFLERAGATAIAGRVRRSCGGSSP